MVVSALRDDLPDWVKENMLMTCPACGNYIFDNSDTGTTTSRWCGNKRCPGHMAHKIKYLLDFLGVKGIGPSTAESLIRVHKFDNHFDVIPHYFKDKKPYVTLAEIADLACIEGYGTTTAVKELSHYATFQDYFRNTLQPNPLLLANKDFLFKAQEYFDIKPPLAARKLYVMGTGTFNGYANRDEFFRLINEAYGMYICVVQTGKRKTGVSYLIKEPNAVDHTKSRIAKECGIPVVTPAQFIKIVESLCPTIQYSE